MLLSLHIAQFKAEGNTSTILMYFYRIAVLSNNMPIRSAGLPLRATES